MAQTFVSIASFLNIDQILDMNNLSIFLDDDDEGSSVQRVTRCQQENESASRGATQPTGPSMLGKRRRTTSTK